MASASVWIRRLICSSDEARRRSSITTRRWDAPFRSPLNSAQMVERGKPAPDLFLYAAERMQAHPCNTLVIEDSVSGVTAAKAAGMTAWGFVGGSHYQSRDGKAILLGAGADRVFERMADFWPDKSEEFYGRA